MHIINMALLVSTDVTLLNIKEAAFEQPRINDLLKYYQGYLPQQMDGSAFSGVRPYC